jgi:type II secretion system protein N
MIRFIKFICISLLVVLCIGIFALISIPEKVYTDYLKQSIVSLAGERDLRLTYGNSHLSLKPSFTAYDLRTTIPRTFIFVAADEITLSPTLHTLATLLGTLNTAVKLYKGTLVIDSQVPLLDVSAGRHTISAHQVTLGEHPQIAALGIQGGRLSGTVQIAPEKTYGDLSLAQLIIPRAITIPPKISGLALPLTLPPITVRSLKGDFAIKGGDITISNLNLIATLLTCTGQGEVHKGQPLNTVSGEVTCTLTEEGETVLGPYIMLASSGALPQGTRSFTVHVTGALKRPRITWKVAH